MLWSIIAVSWFVCSVLGHFACKQAFKNSYDLAHRLFGAGLYPKYGWGFEIRSILVAVFLGPIYLYAAYAFITKSQGEKFQLCFFMPEKYYK